MIRRWDTGEVIADHPIGRDGAYEATFGAPYYGVHRVALLQALGEQLGGDGLHLGHRCVGIEERGSGVELRFADGVERGGRRRRRRRRRALRDPPARRRRRCAAGTPARSATAGSCRSRRCRRCPTRRRCSSGPGPGRHLLHYSIDGGRTVNFLAVVRVPEWTNEAWMEECAVSDAVDAFAGWHPAVTEMVGATDVGARWALHDLAPLERWHTDRVVLIGDAAHAMVPHQGQGANQTIEDAIVLADCLAARRPRRRYAGYAGAGASAPRGAVARRAARPT